MGAYHGHEGFRTLWSARFSRANACQLPPVKTQNRAISLAAHTSAASTKSPACPQDGVPPVRMGKASRETLDQHALDPRDAGAVDVELARHASAALAARRRRGNAVNGSPLLRPTLAGFAGPRACRRRPARSRPAGEHQSAPVEIRHATSPIGGRLVDTRNHAMQRLGHGIGAAVGHACDDRAAEKRSG